MLPLIEKCSECGSALKANATSCKCGWQANARTGPDWARITADRERSRARLFEEYRGPKACQERRCIKHAVPGTEFCIEHTGVEVERYRRPSWAKNLWDKAA